MRSIRGRKLWGHTRSLFKSLLSPLNCIHNFLTFSEKLYSVLCSKGQSFRKYSEVLLFPSQFMGLSNSHAAQAAHSTLSPLIVFGPATLALLSRPQHNKKPRLISSFSRYVLDAISAGNDVHQSMLQVIENNPIAVWEDVDTYLHSIIEVWRLADEIMTIRFIRHRVISRSQLMKSTGFPTEIFENHLMFSSNVCKKVHALQNLDPNPAATIWEIAKTIFPDGDDEEPLAEGIISQRLLARVLLLEHSLSSTSQAEASFCCDLLQRIGGDAIFSAIQTKSRMIFSTNRFIDFVELVYILELNRAPGVMKRILDAAIPENVIEPALNFNSIVEKGAIFHNWNWNETD